MAGCRRTHRWRLLRSGKLSGAMNMAIDEALLESVAEGDAAPALRLYGWQPTALTLGYGQSVSDDVDLDACNKAGVDVVRRSTGGRSVLHADELTYAVVARTDASPFNGTVLDCYRAIAEVLKKALQQLGVDASLVPGKHVTGQGRSARALCFSVPSQYELVASGRKLIGSAQKRRGQAFLQHGSIPLTLDLSLLTKLLKVDSAATDQLAKVGWLSALAPRPLTLLDLEESLLKAFAENLGVDWQQSVLSPGEQEMAQRLNDDQFNCDSWTLKR